jgi:hypothetical protein
VLSAVLGAACLVLSAATASAQMPDPRAMHGQAIPAGDMPAASVSVRVIRQAMGNNVAGVSVELHGAGDVRRAQTGPDGRAQFTALPPGSRVHAVAVVDGERLESTAFAVPAAGGIRAILVAGLGLGTAGAAAPPAATTAPPGAQTPPAAAGVDAGTLRFGNNTRVAIEFQDDTITVFYLLELVNPGTAPTALPSPLTFTLPDDAGGSALLEGASPLASLAGSRVSIAGPVPPGVTSVPVAYRIDSWGASHDIVQAFPLPIDQVAVGIQRLAGLTVQSAQAPHVNDASLGGQAFFVASGPTLPAGTPLRVTLSGLPHKSPWPLYAALALAGLIVAAGVWLSVRTPTHSGESRRRQLEARRARGLASLAALDADHKAGRVATAPYEERRARLLADLERVYGELDAGGGPTGGGQGLAA